MSNNSFERICDYSSNLSSPVEIENALYLVAQNGDILNLKDGQLKVIQIIYKLFK
jgi:hypothetical protein